MDIVAQMKKFMEPKSVALIGVSRSAMTIREAPFDLLANLINCGYQGKIYPVHPQATKIRGLKTYASIADAPANIDLAVINLPRNMVPRIVKECVNKGIKAITIVTQGFADADDDKGKQLQKEIASAISGTDTRILGPNTFGTANAYINFSSAFVAIQMERMPIGFICQTGVFFSTSFADLKLIGKGIDLGNGCDVNFADGLKYFEQDTETKVVGLHIEGMRDASQFVTQVKQVARRKPIVVLKTGRSERAAQAAQSHTGSLVGKDEIWSASLKQAGVTRVDDIEELSDTIKAFYILPPMKGRRIGIVTHSGGFGIMGVDACHKFNLKIAKLSPATTKRLSVLLPSWQNVGNPLDIWPAIMVAKKASLSEAQEIATQTLLDDPGVDAVLCILGAFASPTGMGLNQTIERAIDSHPSKPLVLYFYGPLAREAKDKLEETGKTLVFSSPDRAIRALGHLADYSEFHTKSQNIPLP